MSQISSDLLQLPQCCAFAIRLALQIFLLYGCTRAAIHAIVYNPNRSLFDQLLACWHEFSPLQVRMHYWDKNAPKCNICINIYIFLIVRGSQSQEPRGGKGDTSRTHTRVPHPKLHGALLLRLAWLRPLPVCHAMFCLRLK